ncbi:MAG TPA: tetratricopeptide repeat protein [Bryobacteraceae bacterium]|nr:tetratricopeptide repeat protein [Bryobacteraceae bacterium]
MFRNLLVLTLAAACCVAQQAKPPAQGQRDLKIEKIEDGAAPPKLPGIPRSWAVIVGISHYKNLEAKLQLQYPERDAHSIYTVAISPEGGNFKQENVHVLEGPKATLANIRHEIDEWLPANAKDGDRVLIYFAGHGFMYQGKGYLAPYDFDMNNVKGSGYPMEELSNIIGSKIHATYKILLTDACHSGAISPDDTENLNNTLEKLNPSLFSMTASRARESSYESPELEHGVFTYYVVQGMGGAADVSHDGVVTADELSEYVHEEVRQMTGGKQNPTSDRSNFDPNMMIAFVPANAVPGKAPAPKTGGLVFESNMDGTEVWVDGQSMGTVSKGKPLNLPGLQPGDHTVKGIHMGYEPDGPRQVTVYPGMDQTVSFKILIPRRRDKAATELLDKGVEAYNKGGADSYKKASGLLEQAFKIDPKYSQAAFYLGLTYNALFDEQKAADYYKKAIDIDPDYLEARADYAGMLLDIGDVDEAIRQINVVLTRDPKHAVALTMLAQADRFKELYAAAIEAARKAIALNPKNAEPHMWLGDALRLSGKWADAKVEYAEYLRLSNFDSGKLTGNLNYYVLGSFFGIGKKSRASQHDIWSDLRSLAYFGLCDCDRQLKDFDSAIAYCTRALSYDAKDPYAHYALGISYLHKYVDANQMGDLEPALKHLKEVVALNPDLSEAKFAQQNITQIEKSLPPGK